MAFIKDGTSFMGITVLFPLQSSLAKVSDILPRAECGLPVSVHEVLLECYHAVFTATFTLQSQLSCCNTDRAAHRVENIFYLTLYRKNFPILDLGFAEIDQDKSHKTVLLLTSQWVKLSGRIGNFINLSVLLFSFTRELL